MAGGVGTRMDSSTPKQFLLLAGKPILMHCISAFHEAFQDIQIVVALPEGHLLTWEELCQHYKFTLLHEVVPGGEKRFHSVKNSLTNIPEDGLVAIHDGARPLVSIELIRRSFTEASNYGNAIPSTPVNESLRFVNGADNEPVSREHYRIIQTPQVFSSRLIKKAYETEYDESFTDDATVLELLGEKIHLIEGERSNIKITQPSDLLLAEALMKPKVV